MSHRSQIILALSALFLLSGTQAASFLEVESNDSIATANNIDGAFDLSFNSLIEDSSGVNTSTFNRHVEITSLGDSSGTVDYFSFTAVAGQHVVLDIDCGDFVLDACDPAHTGVPDVPITDLFLALYDPSGVLFVDNDDSFLAIDSGSDPLGSLDSFIDISLSVTGLWTVAAGEFCCPAALSPDLDYVLNVSLTPVPVPPTVWLLGSALGLLGWRCRKVT